jgi:hypothetical protein
MQPKKINNFNIKYRKKDALIILGIIILVAAIFAILYSQEKGNSKLKRESAINAVKSSYPDFASYPSNELPPKGIYAEESNEGWYLAFIQFGSGRPILGADCFFVKTSDNSVYPTGKFVPEPADTRITISPRTCE